jgi:amino acid transporter
MPASFPGEAAVKEKDVRDAGTPVESSNDAGDIEGRISSGFEESTQLKQGLHQRHIQMIALAGTLGTGLFLSSGQAIARSGPLGTWLAYSIIGATLFSVVLAVGEMGALVPLNGGIVRYSENFVDPALAFANGWNEIYAHIVSIPSEITAAAVLVDFWIEINNGIWITVFGVVMLCSALVYVRVYGELEFSFALMKIALVIGINIMVGLQFKYINICALTISCHSHW